MFVSKRRYQSTLVELETERENVRAAYAAIAELLNDLDAHEARLAIQEKVIERGLAATLVQVEVVDNRADQVRKMYADGKSISSIQIAIFGYKGGGAYKFVSRVVQNVPVHGVPSDKMASDVILYEGDNGK